MFGVSMVHRLGRERTYLHKAVEYWACRDRLEKGIMFVLVFRENLKGIDEVKLLTTWHTIRRRSSAWATISLRYASAWVTHRRAAGIANRATAWITHWTTRAARSTGATRCTGSTRTTRATWSTRVAINSARITATSHGRHTTPLRTDRIAFVTHGHIAESSSVRRWTTGGFRFGKAAWFSLREN